MNFVERNNLFLFQAGTKVCSNPCPICQLKAERNYEVVYTVSNKKSNNLLTATCVCRNNTILPNWFVNFVIFSKIIIIYSWWLGSFLYLWSCDLSNWPSVRVFYEWFWL